MFNTFFQIGQFISEGWCWFSAQYWIWWAYFRKRVSRFLVFLWGLFAVYSVLVFLVTAITTIWVYLRDISIPPEKLLSVSTMTGMILGWELLGVGVLAAILMFIAFLVLSIFPKGRGIADRSFIFAKPTEFEKFKGETESRLATLEEFKGKMEKKLTAIDKKLVNIEGILKTIAGNHAEIPLKTKEKTKQ